MGQAFLLYNSYDGYYIMLDKDKYILDEANPGLIFAGKLHDVGVVYYHPTSIRQAGLKKIEESFQTAGVALSPWTESKEDPPDHEKSVPAHETNPVFKEANDPNFQGETAREVGAAGDSGLALDYDLGIGVKDIKTARINFELLVEKSRKLPYRNRKTVINCYYETDPNGNVTIPLYKRDDPQVKLILNANYGNCVDKFGLLELEGVTITTDKVFSFELEYEMTGINEITIRRYADRELISESKVELKLIDGR